jgi:uncharacterized protein YbjT (DUF2867 family)
MTRLVGVIGGGGQTGRYVVADLARRGIRTRGLVRSERSADTASHAGAAETATIDLADEASLTPAVAGLDTLVFIAPPFDANEESYAANALSAASSHQVEHFVYYSVLHAHLPGVPHHLRKLNVEARVRDSDMSWTIVQPTMYQQTLLGLVRSLTRGVLHLPYSPERPFHLVDLVDVAQVVGQVSAEPDDHRYASYGLAGPERMSTVEMVEQIAEATGRELRVEQVPPQQWPLPPHLPLTTVAEMMAMWAKYDRSGYPGNATVLRSLLGREPTSLAATARRELTDR